jgi:hypothetical protein
MVTKVFQDLVHHHPLFWGKERGSPLVSTERVHGPPCRDLGWPQAFLLAAWSGEQKRKKGFSGTQNETISSF